MQNQKGVSTLNGIAIVLAVALFAFGGVFAYQYFFTPKEGNNIEVPADQTAGPALSEVEGWKTYTNTQYGFEIKYPPFYKEGSTSKWVLTGQPVVGFYYKGTNLLNMSVFQKVFSEYRIIDNPGGFIFYFDEVKKQWLHSDGQTSEFVPKKIDVPIEAYIYKSGDITCVWDWIIIPSPSHSYVVEIANTTCGELYDAGNGMDYKKPDFILDSNLLISTFKFTNSGLSARERGCLNSGGTVSTQTCYCSSAQDFYNNCEVGACTCNPASGYSKQVKVCDCDQGKCFDGEKCVDFSH